MTPYQLLTLAAFKQGEAPSGSALLQEADAWVDADQSTITTVDISHNFTPLTSIESSGLFSTQRTRASSLFVSTPK